MGNRREAVPHQSAGGAADSFPQEGEATLTKNSHVCRNGTATGLYPAGKEQLCPKSFVLKT